MASSNFKFEFPAAVQNNINALAMHVIETWIYLFILMDTVW